MKKYLKIVILITLFCLILVCVWFWYASKKQSLQDEIVVSESIQKETASSDVQSNQIQSQKDATQDNTDMVWYDIPEMGVQFKTTNDTKEDLKYFAVEATTYDGVMHYKIATFFSQSQTNKNFDGCHLSENGFTCGRFYLSIYSNDDESNWAKKYGKDFCISSNGNLIYKDQKSSVCLFGLGNMTDLKYKKFFRIQKSLSEKHYGVLVNTLMLHQ